MTSRTFLSLSALTVGLLAPLMTAQAHDWLLPNFAQRLEVTVANPSATRVRNLAAVPVSEAARLAPGFPGTLVLAVILNPKGAEYPFTVAASQVDDLDGDGVADEVVFAVDLAPGETRRVHLYYSTTLRDSIDYAKEVGAAHSFGYNRQTAALESKYVGYRTYGGFFLDVQARAKGYAGLNNSLVGYIGSGDRTVVGQDVLHVGDTLGLGGLFLRHGETVYRPPFNVPDYAHRPFPADAPHYRVVANGPIRAIVEASMERWALGEDAVRLRARYSIAAGQEFVDCDVEVLPLALTGEYEIGTGVLHLPAMRQDGAKGRIALRGTQEARIGSLGLALYYDPLAAHSTAPLVTAEGKSEAIVFAALLRAGNAAHFHYQVAAAWSGSGIDDPLGHLRAVESAARQRIRVSDYAFSRTPEPQRIEGEAQ